MNKQYFSYFYERKGSNLKLQQCIICWPTKYMGHRKKTSFHFSLTTKGSTEDGPSLPGLRHVAKRPAFTYRVLAVALPVSRTSRFLSNGTRNTNQIQKNGEKDFEKIKRKQNLPLHHLLTWQSFNSTPLTSTSIAKTLRLVFVAFFFFSSHSWILILV